MTRIDLSFVVSTVIQRTDRLSRPQLLHDVVTECLVDVYSLDPDTACEEAVELLGGVRRSLRDAQQAAELSGTDWTVEIYGSDDEYLRGASFADTSLSNREQEIRRQRQHVDAIRAHLQDLTPADFEIVCTAVLNLLECEGAVTSPLRDDGGIDFYGRLQLKSRLGREFPYGGIDGQVGVWLIGQAKRYKESNPVQTADIRELVGSVELARTRGAIHEWEGLDIRPFDAVVQLFFTTGRFTSGAQRLLQKSGIISMNGEQLSVFLADCGVGIDPDQNTFDSASFRCQLGLIDN